VSEVTTICKNVAQVSPVRLANCNLHGKQVSSGLSCIIYSMCIRQMVWQPQKYNHSK
jgi:hypothetical protein